MPKGMGYGKKNGMKKNGGRKKTSFKPPRK